MNILIWLRERVYSSRGQTMGEYVLIISSIAVVAFAAYRLLGQDLQQLVNSIAADF